MSSKKRSAVKDKEHTVVHGGGGVSYHFLEGGTGAIQIRVDFSLVDPPGNYYYADAIHLRVDDDLAMATLSFGRRELGSDLFAQRIDIVMPASSVFQGFWSSSREVEAAVDKATAKLRMHVSEISVGKELANTLFANMIFMATGDVEASLDFYHLSPRDVHFAKTKKADMHLQPIVRVVLSIVLAKHLFNLLRPDAERVQSDVTGRRQERATASRR